MALDPRDMQELRNSYDIAAHSEWIKRLTFAVLALFLVLYIGYSIMSPAQVQRIKWSIFGRPEAQQADPAQAPSP
jgi:preprotein translocase subunit SecG